MFDSGVFSPFLGLYTNAQALYFHAVRSCPGLHGGMVPFQLAQSLGAPGSRPAAARLAGF